MIINEKTMVKMAIGGVGVLFALGVAVSGFSVIDTGEAGVVLRLGKYSGVMTEGLNFKTPIIDKVVKMDIREKNSLISTEVSSKDMQTIKVKLNMIYSLNPTEVGKIYQKYQTKVDKILIEPTLLEIVNSVTAKYDIEEFVSHRTEISQKIESQFKERVKGSGLMVKSISVTEHDFDEKFNSSITAKKIAQQDAEKAKYDLERVKLEAEAQKVKANTLTPLILQEKFLDKWDGKMPQYYSGNGLPLITTK